MCSSLHPTPCSGDVYTALYQKAQKEPLNRKQVASAVTEYLLPLLKANRKAFGSKL
jgi:hypothetical protein